MTYAKQSTATVYKALNGRRYLTQGAAYEASARSLVRERCECEGGNDTTGAWGETCRLHEEPHHTKLMTRLVRWMRWRDSRAIGGADA